MDERGASFLHSGPRSWSGRIRFWAAWFVLLNGLWLLFVAYFDLSETILGLAASAVAATAATVVRETRLVEFAPRTRWLFSGWRIPLQTVTETGDLIAILWRRVARGEPIQGRFRVESFGVGRDPRRLAARRALRTIGASIPPNAYVVGIDREHDQVLVHELVTPRAARREAAAAAEPEDGDAAEGEAAT